MVFKPGMFGPIEVRDTAVARQLLLNGQVQGGSFLRPSAATIDEEMDPDDPGPVSEAAYAIGWLIAGLMNPTGSGLMVGLGSGSGIIQLLHNFPGVDLTVVEIDPVMVEMAFSGFPLLEWYMDRGQLNVVVADAQEYLADCDDVWDFACLDAYTGEQDLKLDHLNEAMACGDHLYLNVIDRLGGPIMRAVMMALDATDKPVTEGFKILPYNYDSEFGGRSNWIITNQELDWGALSRFEPFEEMEFPNADVVKRAWDKMLSSSLTAVI